MTAEIAIINRTAVTLAADSAMTLSVGATEKVYNTADKIFELSTYDPIGMMIYNNLEFSGVPLDVAIKHFRDSAKCKSCNSVEVAADQFFAFLLNDIGASEDDQNLHIGRMTYEIYSRIRKRFDARVRNYILSHINKKANPADLDLILDEMIKSSISALERTKPSLSLDGIEVEDLIRLYADAMEVSYMAVFDHLNISDSRKDSLLRLGALVLHRDRFSDFQTGFVVAGFGDGELFPSLVSYTVDGIIGGKLKKKRRRKIKIDRNKTVSEIVPFAQREMVDRFLFGIDPKFERAIYSNLSENLSNIGREIIASMPSMRKATRQSLLEKLEKSIEIAVDDFRSDAVKEIKDEFQKEIGDTVLFMPKQELAAFAESLVNITRLKRKFSTEQETVGGPIDVAVISRSDGFIWVSRKHYFDPKLNTRFFARKHDMMRAGEREESDG